MAHNDPEIEPTLINDRPSHPVLGQSPANEPALPLPEWIGRYRIEAVLGKGGFGLVYLANDEQLRRKVAIKVPHARLVSRAEDAQSYLTEARTVANLDHPHIVPVYDVGSIEGFPFFVVSKYVDGSDLATKIKQSRLSHAQAAELMATVAEALHYAHKRGLVHRDVKPGNIMIDKEGRPFVVDFGLAIREGNVAEGTRYGGTPAYMSPEQARGEGHRVDGRSDIFSLGVVFYELLVGRRPFRGDSQRELLDQVTTQEPRPPRQYDETIPSELERICIKTLCKRASERYTTAYDLSEDLRHFLGTMTQGADRSPSPSVQMAGNRAFHETPVASDTPIATPLSDSRPIRIVPKGLRSFDAHDADFFLELLPGPRDRDGLPDSLRFWKTRIEEYDADLTFSVGLIYGPSGCGKSSFVKAGLLPRLSQDVIAVYVESTAEETETRLLNGLRKRCPTLPGRLSLKEALAELRRGKGVPVGKKVVIVLDQFEQWLHAKKDEQNTELVQALRQCDGGRVQCILMVRDDFWLSVSRFLRELEVRLEGENSALADLFDVDHARKVLAAFGRAFGKLPENSGDASKDQKDFLHRAVSDLAQEGKVVSVRLALFAEMMKGKSWTTATLKEVGGTEGVGVTFLEETFSAGTAPPEHRYHQKAARSVLKSLLPESGIDIKGHMRSRADLLQASGYGNRQEDFDDLIRILDSEIRLITPTDPDGKDDEEKDEGGRMKDEKDEAQKASDSSARYFQLTHDYLVPSLRDWLTRKQKETRRGRAELQLAERAALWQTKHETRQLPSWWEYLSAVWFVPKKHRTTVQQKMLRQAGRFHAVRWGGALAALLSIGLGIWNVISAERHRGMRRQVATAVDAVQSNRGLAVPLTLKELKKLPGEMVAAELKKRYPNAEPQHKLGLAFGLAVYGDIDTGYLCSMIQRSAPDEVDNLVAAFEPSREVSLKAIHTFAKEAEAARNWRLKTRYAVVALHLEDERLASDMCRIHDRPDPIQRTMFIDVLPAWHGNVVSLVKYCRTGTVPALQSGLALAIGSIPAELLADVERADWTRVLREFYETSPETVTHSSAGWAVRQWGAELPPLPSTSHPGEGRQWFVNSLGLTLLKIHPGEFVRKNDEGNDQRVKLTRDLFVSDREISVGQFQKFIDDATYPADEKPEKWERVNAEASSTPDHPVQQVNWYDAVLFCNWLSRKEGRTACYERTGKKEKKQNIQGQEQEFDAWRLVADTTGYRLPTDAEWEYGCRAGTTTEFSSGNDEELLRKYAVFQSGKAAKNGSKLPNGWGFFDMHGNVEEWCNDWYGNLGRGDLADSVADPVGASVGSFRVSRGGCWFYGASACRSAVRSRFSPDDRGSVLGFRVALSPSGQSPEASARVE